MVVESRRIHLLRHSENPLENISIRRADSFDDVRQYVYNIAMSYYNEPRNEFPTDQFRKYINEKWRIANTLIIDPAQGFMLIAETDAATPLGVEKSVVSGLAVTAGIDNDILKLVTAPKKASPALLKARDQLENGKLRQARMVVTHHNFTRRGIGTRVFQRAFDEARSENIEGLIGVTSWPKGKRFLDEKLHAEKIGSTKRYGREANIIYFDLTKSGLSEPEKNVDFLEKP